MALGAHQGHKSGAAGSSAAAHLPPLRVTPALGLLCALIWVLYQLFPSPELWRPFLLIPARFSWVSMFTAPLIHLSPYHLASNLVLLALFGPPLERRLGAMLFLLLYLGAGLLAALLHLAIAVYFQVGMELPASGASGSIAGLMGAYTVLNGGSPEGRDRQAPLGRKLLLLLVAAWICSEVLQGSLDLIKNVGQVAHWAHIGGFLFGLIIMVAMGQGAPAADQLLAEGRLLLRRGQYADAERLLERAWSLQPHDLGIVLSLARAKQAGGAGETARDMLAAALEQEVRNGQPERVLPFYREARTLAPRLRLSSEAFYRIGVWFSEQDAWSEACAALERAAAPGGAGPNPTAPSALYHAAELLRTRLRQPDRAAALLERLLHDYPGSQWHALAERALRQLHPAAPDDGPATPGEPPGGGRPPS